VQLDRAKGGLDRARALEASEAGASKSISR
jgi:hypothetical protein